MQKKSEQFEIGYRHGFTQAPRIKEVSVDYSDGYLAGDLDYFRLLESNKSTRRKGYSVAYAKVMRHIKRTGICYVYLLPSKKLMLRTEALEARRIPKDGCFVGCYTDHMSSIVFREDLIESFVEVAMHVNLI